MSSDQRNISYGKTAAIVLLGLAVGILTAMLAGQLIFDAVFRALHPDIGDFWQNLVTMAIALAMTLIAGGLVFGLISGIFYGAIYGRGSSSAKHQGGSGQE